MENITGVFDIPFTARGYEGTIHIDYQKNDNPEIYGYPDLTIVYEKEAFIGYPVCEASVTYQGKGFRSIFGWVQTIETKIHVEDVTFDFSDVGTSFQNTGMPFVSYGSLPRLFDMPTSGKMESVSWTFMSFLVTAESIYLHKDIHYVAGFEWGYEKFNGEVQLKPIRKLEKEDWNDKIEFLHDHYEGWNFVPRDMD